MEDNQDGIIVNTSYMMCSSPICEQEMSDVEECQYQEEDIIQIDDVIEKDYLRPEKRKEYEEEMNWTEVKTKEKKYKPEVAVIEMYISSSEPLPKQFALANLFKLNGITDIQKVKYVSPYKVRLDMQSEVSAEKLENCNSFKDKGWRVQKAMEKNLSYGVIRDVDLNMSDEEVFNNITCPKPAQLLSIFRLNRRCPREGWARSESVRLCFKGAFLPTYVSVDSLRIRVDPYIFPVSQCSRCWNLGHMTKRCPSNKVVCPKCGDNHDNCDTSSYKCINCGGGHMAMYKSCPAFLKEKRLREIMAEFNCTYRKALTIYVTPSSPSEMVPKIFRFNPIPVTSVSFPPLQRRVPPPPPPYLHNDKPPQANVIQTKAEIHTEEKEKHEPRPSSRRQQRRKDPDPFVFDFSANTQAKPQNEPVVNQPKRDKEVNFGELINRLKEVIFAKDISIQSKLKNIVKCCVEWLILVVVDNITDWPILKQTLDFFMNYV